MYYDHHQSDDDTKIYLYQNEASGYTLYSKDVINPESLV